MKKLLAIAAMCVSALGVNVGVASADGNGATTTTQYTASYDCPCFGHFNITGVHVTNKRFPGSDDGQGDAVGGRDNFTGTVSNPPSVETTWNESNAGDWQSDYDGQLTSDWSVTFEPDGTLSGWAVYPSS